MTEVEANNWIALIKSNIGDDERAHGQEDDMVWSYVKSKAVEGDPVAKILLQSQDLDFARWCA